MDHETGLHPLIERNLVQMGYSQPRPIQNAVRGKTLAGRDIIGLAATGSGKTAAFVAPILHVLLANRPGGNPATRRDKRPIRAAERLRALILCPTRELAQQVQKETGLIAQGSVLRTTSAVGKSAISPQARAIERGVDVLIATPGRAIELLEDGVLSLAHLRFLIIDEGDRMLDMGFLPQIERILQRVGASAVGGGRDTDAPRSLQIMLFSATMPAPMEDLARKFLHEPARIEIGKHTTPVSHIEQRLIPVRHEHKVSLLLHMLGAGDSKPVKRQRGADGVLIFCATRRRVGWVGNALERHGVKVGMLHGDRSQAQRQKALEGFREGALRVLVATDIAARGLHIPAVRTVINYDLPQQPEEYVHRVGRAAHGVEDAIRVGGKPAGEALTLLDSDERVKWRSIVDTTGIRVFAEHEVPGWEPPRPASHGGKSRVGTPAARRTPDAKPRREQPRSAAATATTAAVSMDRRPRDRGKQRAGFDPFNRPPRKRGRTHASKPIKKGQKPGGGVKR